MNNSIAIVGMACHYPDAPSPEELWNNALAGRRAFRRMPSVRMNPDDYLSADRTSSDQTYVLEAAVIDDYEFDRVKFRVAGNTFRSADLAHWLALDVASRALADAGFPDGEGLPKQGTGVVLGNTLTGEFSRANLMRLRWPYVRRVLEGELIEAGWSAEDRAPFLARMEARYKAPFPPIGEESLAGGLSNTIAGRICNYFDLKGGGFTVDGACASSLLAVANACSSLVAGDLDIALAGGVDLSLDPFEIVGFAKTGALAPEKMRVYDARSAGFWPGEGCGFVVLMRHEDAVAQGRRIYAAIKGWGVSSDGSGGITRPEVEGQILALRRAYKRAGYGIETVTYFEGHGTGTNVGDATELQTISRARRDADPSAAPAAIGSVKAIIGHTKAAAGVAGLIKATMALHNQVLPPTVGCETPHQEFGGEHPALRPLAAGSVWPADAPLRASVSAMGFGGINSHVTLEGEGVSRRRSLSSWEETLLRSPQDAELFLMGERTLAELHDRVEKLAAAAPGLSRGELADLADRLQHELGSRKFRAAVVAATPAELAERLEVLRTWLAEGTSEKLDSARGIYLGSRDRAPAIGFLFPGQGSPAHLDGGALRRRFAGADAIYRKADLPLGVDGVSTDVAQPAIATASMAAIAVLERFGIEGSVGVGHSLGELAALHWGGAYDQDALLRIARARGRAMADLGSPTGAMGSIAAGEDEVRALVEGTGVVIAGLNSPRQTVISGDASAVASVLEEAKRRGLHATRIAVSHAFHSPLVAAAAEPLAVALGQENLLPLERRVVSTVTGDALAPDADLRGLLHSQITSPVRFSEALRETARGADMLIEVGPGNVLTGLANGVVECPVIALDAGGPSLKGLLGAMGAAFALGAPLRHRELFADRFARPIDLDRPRRFFENPCEHAPRIEGGAASISLQAAYRQPGINGTPGINGAPENGAAGKNGTNGIPNGTGAHQQSGSHQTVSAHAAEVNSEATAGGTPQGAAAGISVLEVVRALVAAQAELPADAVGDDDRLLGDLHLNSITISQIVVEASRALALPAPVAPTEFANATVIEMAQALEAIRDTGGEGAAKQEEIPSGAGAWVRAFLPELVELPSLPAPQMGREGKWTVIAPDGHPLAGILEKSLRDAGGTGVVVCLLPGAGEECVEMLLRGASVMRDLGRAASFVLLQQGGGAASFARTLFLERPSSTVCVVDLPFGDPRAPEWALREIAAASGYAEIYYDGDGIRRSPVLRPVDATVETRELPLGAEDLLLVTGGGKGIAAESALALARESGAWLLLIGRSDPGSDTELAENLARMGDAGIRFDYRRADVADAAAVARAIADGESALGRRVTAFLHGAGANHPQLIDGLDSAAFARTLAPKLHGARNVLAALDPDRLRLLVTFSSIIGRTGLRGEADYAVANEWLSRLTEEWGAAHPACRCLAIEWSVWSGVGMGEKLGRVETLMREGIHPITPELGIEALRKLLTSNLRSASVVVTGRFGSVPTARLAGSEPPLLRFLEEPRVHYPGVELVSEATLSADTDPYLADHAFRGQRLFPAVLGLEAFAQAASALAGETEGDAQRNAITFEAIRFERPVIVPEDGSTTIRIAALRHEDGAVELALRSEETAFQADHFRALCRFVPLPAEEHTELPWPDRLPFDTDGEMYRDILFQRGRFRRVRGYRRLSATECVVEIAVEPDVAWFGAYLPGALLLGDPGMRDAAIHGIQGCIPHMTLLPVAVERITLSRRPAPGVVFVHARERRHEGALYLYDIEVWDEEGGLLERWEGLLLRAVERNRQQGPWSPALLGPYAERRLGELLPGARLSVAIGQEGSLNGKERSKERSNGTARKAAKKEGTVRRRADGKPEMNGGPNLSLSHAGELTLAVVAPGPVGCDIERVESRPSEIWKELLGEERWGLAGLIAAQSGEDPNLAATRVWAAAESLKKAGAMPAGPLVLDGAEKDGWVVLRSGTITIGTYAEPSGEDAGKLVMAVAAEGAGEAVTDNGKMKGTRRESIGTEAHNLDPVGGSQ